MGKIQRLLPLNWFQFFYYNFLCPRVIRDKGKYIFPKWNTKIEMHKSAKLILHANMYLNENKYPHSKAECYLRLRENALLTVTGPVMLVYRGTIEVHKNAKLTLGASYIQSDTVIICAYKMTIGEGCVFARMCYILDSDHHQILDKNGKTRNYPRETIIGDHVWLGAKVTVQKGTKIAPGCVVGANSIISGNIGEHTLLRNEKAKEVSEIDWSPEGFGDFAR